METEVELMPAIVHLQLFQTSASLALFHTPFLRDAGQSVGRSSEALRLFSSASLLLQERKKERKKRERKTQPKEGKKEKEREKDTTERANEICELIWFVPPQVAKVC